MTAEAPIHEGQILTGPLFSEPMQVETIRSKRARQSGLRASSANGRKRFRQVTLTSDELVQL